jgi:DNA-binding helix-hairpin-helix protein with protein kinase domain
MSEHEAPAVVVDRSGNELTLDRMIGKGGQGRVYSVAGQRLAVKLVNPRRNESPAVVSDRLSMVRRLPLKGLPVAAPLDQLRDPFRGYVMRLADGMTSLEALALAPSVTIAADYLQGGGLQRRLRVLTRLAEALEVLHSRAIVYGDLSFGNVLISADPAYDRILLIDLDNMRLSSAPGRMLTTPEFAAPELERQFEAGPSEPRLIGAPDTLTDAHSLAVVIYEVLTLEHPLLGGELVDEDPANEPRALRGELPWVANPDDERNAQRGGLPWRMVMTDRMFALARRTFEQALTDRTARPSCGQWARELRWAAGFCLRCPFCTQTYLPDKDRPCPWCDTPRPALAIVRIGVCDEEGRMTMDVAGMPRLTVGLDDTIDVRRAEAFADCDLTTKDDVVATVRFEQDHLLYTPVVDGTNVCRVDGDPRPVDAGQPTKMAVPAEGRLGWRIHFGEHGTLHRVAELRIVAPGVAR